MSSVVMEDIKYVRERCNDAFLAFVDYPESTRIFAEHAYRGPGGIYFVVSERSDSKRRYTAYRLSDDGSVQMVPGVEEWGDQRNTRRAIQALAAGIEWNGQGYRTDKAHPLIAEWLKLRELGQVPPPKAWEVSNGR